MKNSYKTTRQLKSLVAYLDGLEGHFGCEISNRNSIVNFVFKDSSQDHFELDFYNNHFAISELSCVNGKLQTVNYCPLVVMLVPGILSFEKPPGMD